MPNPLGDIGNMSWAQAAQLPNSPIRSGFLPAPAPSGVLTGLRNAIGPTLSVVEDAVVPQVKADAQGVLDALSGLKNRLSQIPTGASRAGVGMGTSAQGAADLLNNPENFDVMNRMAQRAKLADPLLEAAGKGFSNPMGARDIPQPGPLLKSIYGGK